MSQLSVNLMKSILDSYLKPADQALASVEKQRLVEEQKKQEFKPMEIQKQEWVDPIFEQFKKLAKEWTTETQSYNQEQKVKEKWLIDSIWEWFTGAMENIQDVSNSDKNIWTKILESAWILWRDVLGWTVWKVVSAWMDAVWITNALEAVWNKAYSTEYGKKIIDLWINATKTGWDIWEQFKENHPDLSWILSWVEWVTEWTLTRLWAKAWWEALAKWVIGWAKWAIKVVWKLNEQIWGRASWVWVQWTERIYNLAKEWTKEAKDILKNPRTVEEIRDSAKQSLDEINNSNRLMYWKNYEKFKEVSDKIPKDKEIIPNLVQDFIKTSQKDFEWIKFDIWTSDNKLKYDIDTSWSKIWAWSKDETQLKNLFKSIADFSVSKETEWASLNDLLILKWKISSTIRKDWVLDTWTQVEWLWKKLIKDLDYKIAEIENKNGSNVYKEMNKEFSEKLNVVNEISKTLSLKNSSSVMSWMTRLNQALKWNTQYRTEMVDLLDKMSWTRLLDELSSSSWKEWLSSGWIGKLWALSLWVWAWSWLLTPWFVIWLASASPKVVSWLARILWYSEKKLQNLSNNIKTYNSQSANLAIVALQTQKEENKQKKVYKDKNWNIINIKQ